jgi:adenylosuccinate lyase
VLRRAAGLVGNLVVHTDRMRSNVVEGSYGLVFSQPVLLALVAAGSTRDDAYRLVQRDAMAAWETAKPFRSVLEADPEVVARLSQGQLDEAFDLGRSLRHVGRVFDALEDVT